MGQQITKDTTISEVLKIDRGAAQLFMKYGMHCIGCPASAGESIEQAGEVHGIDVDKLVEDLNKYLAEK